jgi:hypothetical protein
MTLSPEKRLERSVDSLQKIYAVVIALAIGQSIQTLLVDRGTSSFASGAELLARAPAFLALLVILVPFYHGMNRHLDLCYIEHAEGQRAEGALLFDFFIFFAESCVLFAVAYAIGAGLRPFMFLGVLLAIDVVWATVSHWIHYTENGPSVLRWAGINAVTIAIGLFVALRQDYGPLAKTWLLLVVAVARTVVDYRLCWYYYFPKDRPVGLVPRLGVDRS